jgi:hypothetical protein
VTAYAGAGVMYIQGKIRQYFRSKAKQLLATSEQALSDHSGLIGSHRESILCQFLEDILPQRYSIDAGMVYGLIGQSKEADLVIWDAFNYPKLTLGRSNIYFAEAVKVIIEIKSRWSNEEFRDIRNKVIAATTIFNNYRSGLSERIQNIEAEVWSLKSGEQYEGRLISPNRKGTAVVVYYGGQLFDIDNLDESETCRIDDEYPDIIFFLEAGKIVLKKYGPVDTNPLSDIGILTQVDCAEDALLVFTSLLIDLLAAKSEHVEPPLFFTDYLFDLYSEFEGKSIHFTVTRPISGTSKTFWR